MALSPVQSVDSRLRTMSPEFLYIVKERAPTGSAGTKMYVSFPSMYLFRLDQPASTLRVVYVVQVEPLVDRLHDCWWLEEERGTVAKSGTGA